MKNKNDSDDKSTERTGKGHDIGNNITRTISMSPELFKLALDRAWQIADGRFSVYIRRLIINDLAKGGDFVVKTASSVSDLKMHKT